MTKIKINETVEYTSKRGKLFLIENVDGKLVCFEKKEVKPTKEILNQFEASEEIYIKEGNFIEEIEPEEMEEILRDPNEEGFIEEIPEDIDEVQPDSLGFFESSDFAEGLTDAWKEEKPYTSLTIYTDGGCAVNPGGAGGYGYVILDRDTGEMIKEGKGGCRSTTNNRMEMMALLVALQEVEKVETGRDMDIDVVSDSKLLINCITNAWSRKSNLDLWERLDAVVENKCITYRWVKGHEDDPMNERCDMLATEAIQEGPTDIDEGYESICPYEGPVLRNDQVEGAMSVTIDASDDQKISEAEVDMAILGPGMFHEKYRVNKECAEQLQEFWEKEKRSFRDYKDLRTFGPDEYSAKTFRELIKDVKKEDKELMQRILREERSIAAAIRWNKRGLSIKDAIRKVLVDNEITEKGMRTAEKKHFQSQYYYD